MKIKHQEEKLKMAGWFTLCINISATQPSPHLRHRFKEKNWDWNEFLVFFASEVQKRIENNNILIEPQNSINVFFNSFDCFLWYAITFNFFKNVIIQIEIYQNFEKRKAYFLRLISFNLWKIVIITPSRIPTWRQRTSQNMSRLSLTHQLGWAGWVDYSIL